MIISFRVYLNRGEFYIWNVLSTCFISRRTTRSRVSSIAIAVIARAKHFIFTQRNSCILIPVARRKIRRPQWLAGRWPRETLLLLASYRRSTRPRGNETYEITASTSTRACRRYDKFLTAHITRDYTYICFRGSARRALYTQCAIASHRAAHRCQRAMEQLPFRPLHVVVSSFVKIPIISAR